MRGERRGRAGLLRPPPCAEPRRSQGKGGRRAGRWVSSGDHRSGAEAAAARGAVRSDATAGLRIPVRGAAPRPRPVGAGQEMREGVAKRRSLPQPEFGVAWSAGSRWGMDPGGDGSRDAHLEGLGRIGFLTENDEKSSVAAVISLSA